jgi:ABC-2 type transport system ATP-binding protein
MVASFPPILSHGSIKSARLIVAGVRKSFGSLIALNGVNLEIAAGELFGLLGPNGAGKTTLLSILSGVVPADSGTVELGGVVISPGHAGVRSRIGLAPQDLAFYPDLSARENLRFFGGLYGLHGRDLAERVEESLHAVQLTDRGDDRAGTFSGGMKRRLNLALAVIHRPDILFLDEPTTGVDPQSRNHIFEEVRRLNAQGTTIVYTSHYMEEVQTLCSRVAIIDHGAIIRCAPLEELLRLDDALIRFRAAALNGVVAELQRLPEVRKVTQQANRVEITTNNTSATLPALVRFLESRSILVTDLEVAPPTLERVFLHLTGHALRD